ncbi:PREDICTED: two pore calcium channel protein 2 [Cyprinodon variegatus]|uniref:two pore calcium channel protein 2 n=1 Tax=Cyprinodon variegatus TaxID=28743 RepID=UPI0007426730|nr:PREDICTED: two pore calcium channel protein 2 [Cyprinodon variegatus]
METDRLLSRPEEDGHTGDYGSGPGRSRGGSRASRRMSYSAAEDCCRLDGDNKDIYIQQAVVFIEDAIHYRSINHRVDPGSLRLYRWYYSKLCQWILGTIIAVVLLLAFVERPSSLSVSSDPHHRLVPYEPPCGATESVEMLCIIVFCFDLAVKSYLIGWEEFRKSKWLISYTVVICVSIVDWVLSISMLCDEKLRVRRLVRPFFLLQNSSLMKKTLKCIKRTLPEIASVILLLALHLCLFTMIGMLLFAKSEDPKKNGEWELHFRDMSTSLTSLLVLLTTANNPDVMIPAYSLNRGYAIFFITFSVIGTYCLMNLLTAIIYNQFRGYLLMSVQTSIMRRRLGIRAAFHVLSSQRAQAEAQEVVSVDALLQVMSRVHMKTYYKSAITVVRTSFTHTHIFIVRLIQSFLSKENKYGIKSVLLGFKLKIIAASCNCKQIINLCFILFYLFEMSVKIFAFGWRGYLSYRSNIFDGFLTVLLLILQIAIFITYRLPYSQWEPSAHAGMSLWEMIRLVNMLIVFRFLRIIPDIKFLLQNFIYKWDRSHSCSVTDVEKIRYETSVQFMFREQIPEPTEEELVCQLHRHPHLHLDC